ncbi:hypothetical protein [Erysipelothrix piscisicarius]|uniref:hypothetical protein n=1 Tax=Erysipelothrix piscisicarius TaxID=2485784 RepID=UPI002F921E2A
MKRFKLKKKLLKLIICAVILGFVGVNSSASTYADHKGLEGFTQELDPEIEQLRDEEDLGEIDLNENPDVPSLGGEDNETVTVLNQMRNFSSGARAQRTEGIIEPNGSRWCRSAIKDT